MKFRILPIVVLFLMAGFPTVVLGENSEEISHEEVPVKVRNAFNRFFVEQDPEAWFVSVVKPKGEKKSKRYTATYLMEGKSHAIRFNENGIAVAEFSTTEGIVETKLIEKISTDYPEYQVHKIEAVTLYRQDISAFKVQLARKSKKEIIFVDDQGEQVLDEMLALEFKF